LPDIDLDLIVDFKMTLAVVPRWISPLYSSVGTGCCHKLVVTMKVVNSPSDYNAFIGHMCHLVCPLQVNILG